MLRTLFLGLMIFVLIPFSVFAQENMPNRPLTAETFGSWSLICPEKIDKKTPCQISQIVANDPEGRKVLLGVSVYFAGSPKRPMIDFRLSSIASQTAGIGLKIDNGDEFRLPINECNNQICIATGFLDETMLTRFNKGALCQLAYLLPDRKQMTVPVSLKGFEEAFSKLKLKLNADTRSF